MGQIIKIDLKKNPDVADLVSDKEVGARITLETTIKSKDENFLTLTLQEADEGKVSSDEDDDESEDAPASGDAYDSAASAVIGGTRAT